MNEQDIPIDIHTAKLQDWLVSRRIVPKNIQPQLKDIRNKITNALQDMPAHDRLIKLLAGTNINYYHCKEIVEILKETERDTKSLFGSYGSKRMKDWQEIVSLYEKDNVYLGELAQSFVRNMNYEISGIRKRLTRTDQLVDESLKRAQELDRPEAQILQQHASLLKELGVKGENLQEEFQMVLTKLPDLYKKSIQGIGALQEGIQIYDEFCNNGKTCLPLLSHLIERGNTTVYEYINKEAPLSVQENPIKLCFSSDNLKSSAADNEIDFGGNDDNGGTSSTVSAELIDFGDLCLEAESNLADAVIEGDGIDWGIEEATEKPVEINFDIPMEEYGIVVEQAGMDGGVAKDEQAYTLLDSPSYRDRILDEFYELEAFLKMRLYEISRLDTASTNFIYSLSDNISTHDAESLRKVHNALQDILQKVENEQIGHLYQLKHSPKYANLLVSKLKQMTKTVEKLRATKEALKQKAAEQREIHLSLQPALKDVVEQTKQLQRQIECDISKRYKNREVNLIGASIN